MIIRATSSLCGQRAASSMLQISHPFDRDMSELGGSQRRMPVRMQVSPLATAWDMELVEATPTYRRTNQGRLDIRTSEVFIGASLAPQTSSPNLSIAKETARQLTISATLRYGQKRRPCTSHSHPGEVIVSAEVANLLAGLVSMAGDSTVKPARCGRCNRRGWVIRRREVGARDTDALPIQTTIDERLTSDGRQRLHERHASPVCGAEGGDCGVDTGF